MAPRPDELMALVAPYLERQPWYLAEMARSAPPASGRQPGANGLPAAELVDAEVLRDELPGLASVVVAVGELRFHVLVGWREPVLAPAVLAANQGAVLGLCSDGADEVLAYDALADDELARGLLELASAGAERAARVRIVQSLVSHASLVYDERLFMKSYRVLEPSPRQEVELLLRLDEIGFNHLLGPVAVWQRGGFDLALVREFVPGAVEGRALALTSLRDLLARAGADQAGRVEEPGAAGGDLASEMRRLGEMTARLHLALREAFGAEERLGGEHAGEPLIRVHGDYHLRRVMRIDSGWILAGFGDDPLIGLGAGEALEPGAPRRRSRFASPLEDLADLFLSTRDTAAEAVMSQPAGERDQVQRLADLWLDRNLAAVLTGYLSAPGADGLVGGDRASIEARLDVLVALRAERLRGLEG